MAIAAFLPGALGVAWAHEAGDLPGSAGWNWDPTILAALAASVLWYAAGLARMRREVPGPRIVGRAQAGAFAAGIAALFVALISPVDTVGEQLFSVHMVQHLVLIFAAPPLLVASRPAIVFLWALPPRARPRVGRAWIALGLGAGVRAMMHPLPVWLLFCGAFALWHLPKPHQDALENEAVHALEHASFLLTALMFWSIVIEPSGRRRLGYGATLVLVVTTAALSGMPGALLALAPRPLYSAYAAGAAAWGMTPMEDQQLAGLVMWVPAGFAYVAAAAVLFVKWLAAAERDMRRSGRSAVLRSLAVLLVPLILAACDVGTKATAQAVGQAAHGAVLIRQYGCGSCHVVPGIDGADGLVGPPLLQIGRRIYVAGVLRNTPDNLVAWLQNPQRFVPGNAMPDMGMGEADARDVAAYLYTLR